MDSKNDRLNRRIEFAANQLRAGGIVVEEATRAGAISHSEAVTRALNHGREGIAQLEAIAKEIEDAHWKRAVRDWARELLLRRFADFDPYRQEDAYRGMVRVQEELAKGASEVAANGMHRQYRHHLLPNDGLTDWVKLIEWAGGLPTVLCCEQMEIAQWETKGENDA